MKTLYLHIGTAKTATSSIQKYCADNRNTLLEYSYCFPSFPFKYSGVTKYRNGHFLYYPVRIKRAPTPEDTKVYLDNLKVGLDIVHECFLQSDNVILSEETLWLAIHYSKYNPLQILKDDAKENGYTIKVIVYLRRQDAYLISRWNQLVKRQHLALTFKQHLKYIKKEHPLLIQYDKGLKVISDMIGSENVIVRRFEPSTWVEHSIYEDFKDAISLDKDAPLVIPEQDSNLSLKGNAIEIKRDLNRFSSLTPNDKRYLNKFVKQISNEIPDGDMYGILSASETAALIKEYHDGNQRVAKEWFNTDEPLFSEEIKDIPKWEPNNEYMPEDLLMFFEALSNDKTGKPLSYTDSLKLRYFLTLITQQRGDKKAISDISKQYHNVCNQYEEVNAMLPDVSTQFDNVIKPPYEKIDNMDASLKALHNDFSSLRYKAHHPLRTLFKRIFKKGN